MNNNSKWEVLDMKVGEIVLDKLEGGLRFIIMRGPCALCAYVGVPENHPLAGFDYDSIGFIDCHGGLTFSSKARDSWPEGWWWYGWDYSHLGDQATYDVDRPLRGNDKKWTVKEVEEDSWGALCDFKRAMQLAEKIYNNTRKAKC